MILSSIHVCHLSQGDEEKWILSCNVPIMYQCQVQGNTDVLTSIINKSNK